MSPLVPGVGGYQTPEPLTSAFGVNDTACGASSCVVRSVRCKESRRSRRIWLETIFPSAVLPEVDVPAIVRVTRRVGLKEHIGLIGDPHRHYSEIAVIDVAELDVQAYVASYRS